MKHKKSKKKKRKFVILNLVISILLLITSIYLLYKIYQFDIFKMNIFIVISSVLLVIDILIISILNRKFKLWFKFPFAVLTCLLIVLSIYGSNNLDNTSDFLKKVVLNAGVKEEVFEIYVLNKSKFNKLSDLDGKTLGIYVKSSNLIETAVKSLNKQSTMEETKYDDIEYLLTDLLNEKIDAIYISKSVNDILSETYEDTFSNLRLVKEIVVTETRKVTKINTDVTKDSFTILISGIDTSGSIKYTGRSDVNILAVVNPKTEKVLLVHTPRDYYVKLKSKNAYDKLTHTGIYGIEETISSMEDLYSTDIDFYFKVNFSTLTSLVESLDGITVDVPLNFCEQDSKRRFGNYEICLKKGTQVLNGEQALALARHRHSIGTGDIGRGENQELVIKSIIKKMTSPEIISKFPTILNNLSKYLETNMSETNMSKLVKYQINENPNWNIESINTTGTNSYEVTYSGGKHKLYVMIKDDSSITRAKIKINSILTGEDLDLESESK